MTQIGRIDTDFYLFTFLYAVYMNQFYPCQSAQSASSVFHQTLEELENDYQTEPDFPDDTEQRIHALRKTPLDRLSIGDIHLLISRNRSLHHLLPLAIEKLSQNVFAEGDFYPGDLLQSVLNIDVEFWYENRPLWTQVHTLIRHRAWELDERGISTERFMELS